jgi:PAS domain S-box-containing protein
MEFVWVFLIGILLAAAALLPAAAMKVHLNARMAELRAHYKKLLAKLESESLEARFSVDRDGRIRTFNHRAEQLFGFHHQEIIGRTADQVFLVSRTVLPSYVIESLYKSTRSADKQGLEVTGRRKDGTYFPMELHISESGGYLNRKFHLTVRDLSERDRARENEEELGFLAGILQYAGTPIVVLDVAGRVVRHNTAFERVTGYTAEEITQATYWDLLMPEADRDESRLSLRQLIAGSGTVAVNENVEWLGKDGARTPLQLSITAIPGDEERVGLALMVAFEPQAGAAAGTLDEDVEKVASSVAGEFGAVVASISGRCELLLHRLGDNETRREVEAILSASERAAALGNQLMDVSYKLPAAEEAALELNDVILDLKPVLKSLLGDRIQLTASLGPENTELRADRKTIEHLVLSLAINARDSMPEGGNMTVETASVWLDDAAAHRAARLTEGQYVVLTVSDTGSGVQLVQRARAFDPYYTPSQGANGLSAVLSVVRQMGGNAVMQSIPDSGVSVRIFLPAMAAAGKPYLVRGVAVS